MFKSIQHLTEQRTKFVLCELLYSLDHHLCWSRCCSILIFVVWWRSKMLGKQSNIPFFWGVTVRCLVKCWTHLTTLSSLLDSPILTSHCLYLIDANVLISMENREGAHKTLEMLDGKLYSFYHPEQSSTEQGGANFCAARWIVRFLWPGP